MDGGARADTSLADPSMNSPKQFATAFTSIWSLLTPTMDRFIRKVNMNLFEQEFAPMETGVAANRRGFINEVGFRFFGLLRENIYSRPVAFAEAVIAAAEFIDQIEAGRSVVDRTVDQEERRDIDEQAMRLENYSIRLAMRQKSETGEISSIELKPYFKGCGFIDGGVGDFIVGEQLVEVKGGDRSFRSIDLRQVLTYLALNKSGNVRNIQAISLLNVRKGVSFEISVDDLASEVSGRPANNLLHDLTQIMSSGGISR